MAELHLLQVNVRPCAFVKDILEGSWRNLKETAAHQNANKRKIVYGFKIVGENRLLAILEGDVEGFIHHLNSSHGDQITVTCLPFRSFETFAHDVLGLEKTLFIHSKRNLANGEGHLFWITFKVEYKGLSPSELLKIWSKDARALLTLRNRGELALELFKVVGQREVHLFVCAPNSDIMDDVIFTLPIIKEIGNQVELRTKTIKCLPL